MGDDVCEGGCVDARRSYCTIPTVGNLRGRSFSFPPELTGVKLLNKYIKSAGKVLNVSIVAESTIHQ
jgi:hypothetical protein